MGQSARGGGQLRHAERLLHKGRRGHGASVRVQGRCGERHAQPCGVRAAQRQRPRPVRENSHAGELCLADFFTSLSAARLGYLVVGFLDSRLTI